MSQSFLSSTRHVFKKYAPWMLISLISGCVLLGIFGELIPSSPPDLEIDAPDSISFTHNQAPIFDVLVTNTSTHILYGCAISGEIEGADGIAHHRAIYPFSVKFQITGGTQQSVRLTIPPGGLPSAHTSRGMTLLASCAGFRLLKQMQLVTLSTQ
jgi:hypothetical protein